MHWFLSTLSCLLIKGLFINDIIMTSSTGRRGFGLKMTMAWWHMGMTGLMKRFACTRGGQTMKWWQGGRFVCLPHKNHDIIYEQTLTYLLSISIKHLKRCTISFFQIWSRRYYWIGLRGSTLQGVMNPFQNHSIIIILIIKALSSKINDWALHCTGVMVQTWALSFLRQTRQTRTTKI